MLLKKAILLVFVVLASCTSKKIELTHGTDESAGGGSAFIISTPLATYYLEK